MVLSFDLDAAGLEGCRVLLERSDLALADAVEGEFAGAARRIRRHRGFGAALGELAGDPDLRWLIAIRNPRLVLDDGLAGRLAAALARLEALDAAGHPVSIAAGAGLTADGRRVSMLYSAATPALPVESRIQPLVDPSPDFWIADAHHLAAAIADGVSLGDTGVETIIALMGWLDGRLALVLPELTAGIDGSFLHRDIDQTQLALNRVFGARLAGQRLETLTGPVTIGPDKNTPAECTGANPALDGRIDACIRAACPAPSLSIVVRTRFDRPHLLARLLASLSRARLDDMSLEIVLSTDLAREDAEAGFAPYPEAHPYLTLRLAVHAASGPSRVTNLIGGIRAARNCHVAVIDDDDYVDLFAFDEIAKACFLGAEPLMIAPSEVHDETWVETASGRHVLAGSAPRTGYPTGPWRRIFAGVNTLPICAMVMPRERLVARLEAFAFNHDLSEDYALFLLVLTDPALPPIVELGRTFAHISLRSPTENSTMMTDRRPWTADITRYFGDLTTTPAVAGLGVWQLLAGGAGAASDPIATVVLDDCRTEIARLRREVALLEAERRRLIAITAAALDTGPARPPRPADRKLGAGPRAMEVV